MFASEDDFSKATGVPVEEIQRMKELFDVVYAMEPEELMRLMVVVDVALIGHTSFEFWESLMRERLETVTAPKGALMQMMTDLLRESQRQGEEDDRQG